MTAHQCRIINSTTLLLPSSCTTHHMHIQYRGGDSHHTSHAHNRLGELTDLFFLLSDGTLMFRFGIGHICLQCSDCFVSSFDVGIELLFSLCQRLCSRSERKARARNTSWVNEKDTQHTKREQNAQSLQQDTVAGHAGRQDSCMPRC